MKLLSGNSNKPLSKNIAKYLKSKLVNSSIRNFSDGEIYVEINENIRGNSIFIIQSVSSPANDNLMELLLCIDALKRSSAKNITAVIGPSISQKNYEVKDDFKKKFIQKDKKNYIFFKNKKNRLYFDLTNYIYASLKTIKIKNIDILKIDTFDIKNKFFSARRALKLKHNDYGRNISIIMLN